MSSVADICNVGLAHIGAEATITSIDPPDGTPEAGYCKTFYPLARRELLESYSWSFALRRVTLAETTNPSSVWLYAYALPSDCLSAVHLMPGTGPAYAYDIDLPLDERDSPAFELEGGLLLTNTPDAVLKYKVDLIDSAKFTPLFASALGMLVAAYLAGPIIKGTEGIRVGQSWRQAAMTLASAAATSNANASSERSDFQPSLIKVRQ